MSDEGEKTCPLCAEEMDLTDRQLRPCRCGYDICVWCWHHIMDMSEKDDTEGRCPACRTPYNKEKIVGTASNCERLVAEMSVDKKPKSQKGKPKTSEGRKQLSSVRVIQRNLVYIVGLPLNLADEDLLQRKEYFGQYGKVLKVSISRTAAGAIQHFANNTCSVYITYSKEDEAVRSIQSVHGFVLEGRPLRACFGTTKYCHAWLRSMPCTNPDCLYLHEFGSQEDSFTKDEIISEYTRGRVQQVNGVTNDMQRRSGNMLPPAADDYSNNTTTSWPKPITKSTTNDPVNSMKVSPPNSSSGRSVALPAAASWGTRASNSQPLPSKQKVDTCTTLSFSTAVVSPSSHDHEILNKEGPTANDRNKSVDMVPNFSSSSEILDVSDEERMHQLSSDMSSVSIGRDQELQPCDDEKLLESVVLNKATTATSSVMDNYVLEEINKVEEVVVISEVEADLLSFNDQRLRDPEVTHTHAGYVHNMPQSSHFNNSMSNGDSLFKGYNGHSYFSAPEGSRKQMGIYDDDNTVTAVSNDLGENSIISNILSMDFDPWDESLSSPQNLAKLLGEKGSQRVSGSRKTQNCNQSRFSFARDDKYIDQQFNFTQNLSNFGNYVSNNGFSFNFEESDRTASNHSFSSNKISVSRSQISTPPGFMGPSKTPPPGFAFNETYDNLSGNHMFNTSSLLRKMHQAPASVYNDFEFMDPAILAVGGRVPNGLTNPGLDIRSNFPSQVTAFENDNNRLRLLMQRSFMQQNQRFNELGDNLSFHQQQGIQNNRSVYQQHANFQQPRMSNNNNGHWDNWNEIQNINDIAMAEIIRNERLGFNKYYSGYEDTKFRMPSSGDLYNNRTFGI